MCLLLSFAFPIVNGNVCAKSSNEVEIEPSFNVKRRWYVVPKYFPYGEEPPYIFYEDKGFKGYLSIRSSFPYEGTAVIYEGYLYSGDKYPIPATINEISYLNKKTVSVYVKYTEDIVKLPNYWYNVGGYKGWLFERDADVYENSDGSWDVYYKGTVIYCPKCDMRSK